MEIQNVYAHNIKGEEIHISEAESGKKGYFCMGCKREMQAVKQSKENRRSFFRHDHNALKGEGLCTFSDETYRHQIAKQYLINIKKVKVPAVYKFPPKDFDGIANLISKEKYIEASFVIPELSFYEILIKAKNIKYIPGDKMVNGYSNQKGIQRVDLTNLEFEDSSFDCIVSNHVL